jgi:lipid A 4'-phosphatase
MKRRSATRLYAATVALLAIVFMLFPQIDLGIQRWFYRPGQGFVLDGVQPFAFIHDHLNWIAFAAVVLSVAVFVNNLRRDTDVMGLRWRGIIFVLVSLAVGPGLLANTVLKDNWGRARPSQIIEFGGTERFTPAPIVSNQCGHNCSFVAGDPSLGFWLIAFALLMRRHRAIAAAAAITTGIAIGIMRVGQGGHFASDVIFSGMFTSFVVWLLYVLIVEPDGPGRLKGAARSWLALGKDHIGREFSTPRGRLYLVTLATGLLVLASLLFVDIPLAAAARRLAPATIQPFRYIEKVGLSDGWLALSALGWIGLQIYAWANAARAPFCRSLAYFPLFVFLAIAVSGLTTDLIKFLLGRTRPSLFFGDQAQFGFGFFQTAGAYTSFPSGHSTTVFAIATILTLIWRPGMPIYAAGAILVGVSRVITGAHWPSDVVAGAFIGVVVTLYIYRILALNGVALRDTVAGTARWQRKGSWAETLMLDRLIAAIGPDQVGVSEDKARWRRRGT